MKYNKNYNHIINRLLNFGKLIKKKKILKFNIIKNILYYKQIKFLKRIQKWKKKLIKIRKVKKKVQKIL